MSNSLLIHIHWKISQLMRVRSIVFPATAKNLRCLIFIMICVVCSFLIKKYWIWYSFEKVFAGKLSCINFSLIELSLGIFIGKISKESAGKSKPHLWKNNCCKSRYHMYVCIYNIGSTHMVLFNVKDLILTSKLPDLWPFCWVGGGL